jgi:hypothetical protein
MKNDNLSRFSVISAKHSSSVLALSLFAILAASLTARAQQTASIASADSGSTEPSLVEEADPAAQAGASSPSL